MFLKESEINRAYFIYATVSTRSCASAKCTLGGWQRQTSMILCRSQISNKYYYYYYYYYIKSWITLKKPKRHSLSPRLHLRFKTVKSVD